MSGENKQYPQPDSDRQLVLVLGGARSGKSAYAEGLAHSARHCVVIATLRRAENDAEMAARVEAHRKKRPPHWLVCEEDIALAATITRKTTRDTIILVDCLTLWMANLLADGHDIGQAVVSLLSALDQAPGPVILVSNEVGQGIVPANALARRFRDEVGLAHQRIAALADRVIWVVAGIAVPIKT